MRRSRRLRALSIVTMGTILLSAGCASRQTSPAVTAWQATPPRDWRDLQWIAETFELSHWRDHLTGRYILAKQGKRFQLVVSPGSSYVMIQGTFANLSAPPVVIRGRCWVPPDISSLIKRHWPKPPAQPKHDGIPAQWRVPLKKTWKYIIVHHSATGGGNAAYLDKLHRNKGWNGLGYDFVICNGVAEHGYRSEDGAVEVGYRWTRQLKGAHTKVGDYNVYGIGVCLIGNFEKTSPTAKQLESLEKLVRFLVNYCAVSPYQITGHGELKATKCPGKNFPLQQFKMQMRHP